MGARMDNLSWMLGRDRHLFSSDFEKHGSEIGDAVRKSRFLVVGGAGSIGRALTKLLFQLEPKALHVVDISENGLVELVRDIRSSKGYFSGDFRTFALDYGDREFGALLGYHGPYEYVANLAALKHVRSEKDPFTLMRMLMVNIVYPVSSLELLDNGRTRKYFAVSTDKAANPTSIMGVSKRIMESYLAASEVRFPISTARFANVAFSNGSLLDGFRYRVQKRQPLSAPSDIRRYFISEDEAGRLCLLSLLLGHHKDIFFPWAPDELKLTSFAELAERFLLSRELTPVRCETEEEARAFLGSKREGDEWPLYLFESDTTGEKPFEEFYVSSESVDWNRYQEIGVVKNEVAVDPGSLDSFLSRIMQMRKQGSWTKKEILSAISEVLPGFTHVDKGKSLDQRM